MQRNWTTALIWLTVRDCCQMPSQGSHTPSLLLIPVACWPWHCAQNLPETAASGQCLCMVVQMVVDEGGYGEVGMVIAILH